MLESACFLCFWHLFRELTQEESPKQIKDAIMTVAAQVHTLILDAGCELRAERSVRMIFTYEQLVPFLGADQLPQWAQ